MASRHRGKRWLPWVGLAASLLVIAAAVILVVATGRQGDVSNPNVEFNGTQTETQPHGPVQVPPKRGHPADDGFKWPYFGFDAARTRVLGLPKPLRPPFRIAWLYNAHELLEFSPVSCGRSVFLLGDSGDLFKISRWTGQLQWRRKLGDLASASPACSGGRVFVPLLRGIGSTTGRIAALDADKGRLLWSQHLAARAESSPLLVRGKLYFGDEGGTVFAMDVRTGRHLWTFQASGAVKGALALDKGILYFGTYGGRVYAIRLSNGHEIWEKNAATSGAFGLGGGNFYSTAAVEYGRVYIGATNGAIYSFSARSGSLAWRKQTGNYVYASPAVGAVAGGPPTVWIGSYNGTFYALNAQTGAVRWQRSLGGKLSGAPSVIGDLVFVSSFNLRTTWALGANTGKVIWKIHRGAFNPVISDGRRIYFNGYATLFGLDPRGHTFAPKQKLPRHTPAFKRANYKKRRAQQKRSAAQRRAVAKRKKAARGRAAAHRRAVAKHRRFCKRHPHAKSCRKRK
jgi:outer membrane protein assembly factor BamB